jgi:hypothetical protein
MSLITYAEVRLWEGDRHERDGPDDAAVVRRSAHGKFHNERRLNEQDIAIIAAWAARGAPQGNPADLPAMPTYDDGWRIKPDVVFEMPMDLRSRPTGTVNYKHFDVPTNFTEDKWIRRSKCGPAIARTCTT